MRDTAIIPAALRRPLLALTGIVLLFIGLLAAARPGQAQDAPLPPAPPDAAAGLELYEARCANCHGETGGGDGELSGNLPARPKKFDEAYRRTTLPATIYNQITNGNAAVAMPPFGPASSDPIAEQGRWDLVGAIYALSTPPEMVMAGEEVYQASCANCHGPQGKGDGPDAAATTPAATDLTSADYWFNRSNDDVLAAIAPGAVAAHDYTLGEAELLSVVDYGRTFSYGYIDPAVLNAPIPIASVIGTITNGTTGTSVGDTSVLLRAFTPDFNETLTLTTTASAAGGYQFDLTDVPPDWVFIVSTRYNDLSFSSDASQISRSAPELTLPINVYEQTTDPSVITLGQLHLVLQFVGETVQVSELYVINNNSDSVFMGEAGTPETGVIEIALPAEARIVDFQRSFGGSMFLPATDFIETERGWADPQAIGPGAGAMTLLAEYELPYESGMSFSHPVYYRADSTTIIMSDVGVEVTNTPWVSQGLQDFGDGQTFMNYIGPSVQPGETISIKLEGRPELVQNETGEVVVNRNQTTELIIGGTALLAVASAGIFYMLYRRQQAALYEEDEDEAYVAAALPADDADDLLRQIADLDAAFEAGGIQEAAYQQQRAELKRRLAAVWGR